MANRRALSWSAALRDLKDDRTRRQDVREERLKTTAGLRGSPALPLSAWRGRSGRRYVVGVHPAGGFDLDEMAQLLGDSDVMRFYDRPKTRKEAEAWIEWNLRLYANHGYGLWVLRLRDTGEFVGDCGLTQQLVDGRSYIEVGYHVRASLQRRGLATEAATACKRYAADQLGLDYLMAIIDPDNRPSQLVAEKMGLTEAWRTATTNEGRPCVIFAGDPREPE